MTRVRRMDEAAVRRLAQASAWRVRLSEEDGESSAAFETWLAAEPANALAWAQVQGPWTAIGQAATSPEVMAARRDALHRARRSSRRRWAGPRVFGRVFAGAAVTAACAAAAVAFFWTYPPSQDYRTDLGERRVVTLSDGSRVSLDSGSEVKIRYTRDARRLVLLAGQARFDVAHNVRRPFSVRARGETVVATGTAFNIDLTGPKVLVTLIQGRVTVLNDRQPQPLLAITRARTPAAPLIVLVAGQQLVAAPGVPPRVEVASLDRIDAWESGQLVFDDETLASVAERISRYTSHPITVGPDAAGLRMSGVFNAGDAATFVDTVTHYLPVEAEAAPDGSISLRHKG